jgi:hypothetical protein
MSKRSLRELVAALLPGYTPRQMTYDLGRLRRNGFLIRVEHSNRYRLTTDGGRLAVFFAKTYTRVVTPALSGLDPPSPPRSPPAQAQTGRPGAQRSP